MKKLPIIFSVLFMLLFLTACAGGPIRLQVFNEPAWGVAQTAFERKEYRVTVFSAIDENGERVDLFDPEIEAPVVARGHMEQRIRGFFDTENRVKLIQEMYMQWEDVALARENRGLRDEINSSSIFRRDNLSPVMSVKTNSMGSRLSEAGDFLFNNSFTHSTNFLNNTSIISAGQNEYGEWLTENRSVGRNRNTTYDNEQAFVLLRSFRGIQPGGSVGFTVHNPVEHYLRGNNRPLPISVSASPIDTIGRQPAGEGDRAAFIQEIGDFIVPFRQPPAEPELDSEGNEIEFNPKAIDYMEVVMSMAEAPQGPAHHFFITHPEEEFRRANSERVTTRLILKYVYDIANIDGSRLFRVVYELVYYDAF